MLIAFGSLESVTNLTTVVLYRRGFVGVLISARKRDLYHESS